MATLNDLHRIAVSLPGVVAGEGEGFSFADGKKTRGFIWLWKERVTPKKPRVPNRGVIALRVADLEEKEALLALDAEKFFTEPHYNNYPAVLVRLSAIGVRELRAVLTTALQGLTPQKKVPASPRKRGTR